jgi:hypothetical protein
MPDVSNFQRDDNMTPEEQQARLRGLHAAARKQIEEDERRQRAPVVPLPAYDPTVDLEELIEQASATIEVVSDLRDRMQAIVDRVRAEARSRLGVIPPEPGEDS